MSSVVGPPRELGLRPGIVARSATIAIIDGTLPDQALLTGSLPIGATRIIYDPATQSAEQVLRSAALAAKAGGVPLQSLMIFSHGSAGDFAVGDSMISADDLRVSAAQWKELAGCFTDGATIDLYACDAAAGARGQALLDGLHALTGAAVFGSTNITGHDGDWTLEARSRQGSAASSPPLDTAALHAYPADLLLSLSAPPTATPSPVTGTTASLSVAYAGVGGTAPTITWSVTAKPTGASVTFSSNANASASNTVATFTKAGNYTVAVNAYDPVLQVSLGSTVSFAVNQTLTGVALTPSGTTLAVGGGQQFVATALDQFGNAMATQPSFTWGKTGVGSIGASGLYTAPGSAGSALVTATAGGISGSAAITVAATGPTIATPAAASPSTVTGTSTTLSVLGADALGESALTYTWAATTEPVGASVGLTANGTNTAKQTTATFNRPGVYVMTATISDGSASVSSATTITVGAALHAVSVTPGGTSNVGQNGVVQFTATGYDQFGNPLLTQPTMTWTTAAGSVGSVSATGLYTAPAGTGTATVQAASGGFTGTAAVTVVNTAPTVAVAASATAVSALNTATLSVLGADDAGEGNLTYSWAATTAPAGANPTFAANGTNAAKNVLVTLNRAGTYVFTATISDGQGLSTSSSVTVVAAATGTTLNVGPAATLNLHENGTQQLTANVLDQFGAALPVQPAITYSVTSGGGNMSSGGLFTAPAAAGTSVVHVTAAGLGTDVTVNVTNASPTVVAAATATPAVVTGTTAALNVLGADDGSAANLTYTWSATSLPGGAAAPTFSAGGTNAAKHATATFSSAGAYTLTVAISDGTNVTTSSTAVTVAQTLTGIAVAPPSTSLDENGVQQFTATSADQFGAPMLVPPAITWSTASGIGSVTATGLYTAPGSSGTATIEASSGAVTGAATVTVANAAPVITAPPAATPNPVAGNATALSVGAGDDGSAANLTYTWSATAKPAGSNPTFSANGSLAAATTGVTFDAAGSYTFAVAVSDGTNTTTATVPVTVAQTLSGIAVTTPSSQLPENGTAQLTATAVDQFGTALAVQPTFAWSATGSGASVSATGAIVASPLPGLDTFTAAVNGSAITGSASVTVNNAVPTVAQPATPGQAVVTGTSTTLALLGSDDGGEANLTYTWSAAVAPPGANPTFATNGTNASKNDVVTFDAAGTYVLTATISDGTNSFTSSIPVTVAQTLSGIAVTPATAALNLNAVLPFNAGATDQFGHAILVPPAFAWSDAGVGSVTAGGTFSSGTTAGTATVTASSGGITGSAAVAVTDAAPTIAAPAAAAPSPVTGTTVGLTVLGADDGGEANLTYTWAATAAPAGASVTFSANGTNAAKNAVATFDRAGTYVLTADVSDGISVVPSSVTVSVGQTVSSIVVTPGSASLNLNGQQQFAAAAFDQFGQPMAAAPTFAWAVWGAGGVTASGLFTAAGTPGTSTLSASSNGVAGTTTISVANAAPTVVTAASASPGTVTGTTVILNALGADDGGAANLAYTWSATTAPAGASPTFSADGTNAARNTTVTFDHAGTYTFQVQITDAGGLTATSSVGVTVQQTLGGIVVSPPNPMTGLGGTQQFTAVADDQFGNPMAAQPAVAWAVAAGGGTIDAAGLYTAPAAIGIATVTATFGGVSGAATAETISAPTIWSGVDASGTSAGLVIAGLGDPAARAAWSVTSMPAGAVVPTFSANGTSAAQSTTITFTSAGTYGVQAMVNGTTLTSTVAVTQQLGSISVAPSAATLDEDAAQQFTATAYDQFGTPMAVQPPVAWAVTQGSGSIDGQGLYTASAATGPAQVTASSVGVSGSASVTIVNAAPTIASAPTATPTPVTGTTADLAVLGADDAGEGNLAYTWSGGSGNPAGASFSSNAGNASKHTTVTFAHAGTYTFDVAVSDGTDTIHAGPLTVTVTPVPTQLAVSPGTGSLNESGTLQFAATAYDQFGDALATQPTVTWNVASGEGTVDQAGLYTAPGTAGTATVQAVSGPLHGTAPVTVSNALPVVSQPAAASPSPVVGTTATLSAAAQDDGGASNLTYTWSATAAPAGANPTFSNNGTAAAQADVVTFDRAGNYTFLATISDGTNVVQSAVNVVVDQTLGSILIVPSTAAMDENAIQPFTAMGMDQFGVPLTVQPGFAWAVASGVGSVDANGTYHSGATPGTVTLQATSGGAAGTASVTVANAIPTVATAAIASPATVIGTAAALSVLGADDGGEANLTYTWAATLAPAGAAVTFGGNGAHADQSDVASFDRAGNYTLTVTISDGTSAAASSVNVTVAQTLTGLQVTPVSPVLLENAQQQFAVAAVDQFGGPMVVAPTVTWTVTAGGGTIDSSGLYTAAGLAGPTTVQATADGVSQSVTFATQNGVPMIATAAAASPADVTSTTTSLSVLGSDDGGEANLTYTWAATLAPAGASLAFATNGTNAAKNDVVTFDTAGDYVFAATVSDGTSTVSSSVAVTVEQTLSSISVTPTTASLMADGAQQFTATALDRFGHPLATQPAFTWVSDGGTGSVDANGLYTADGQTGSAVVAASAGGRTGVADASVSYSPPTVASPATASPAGVTGETTNLSALGASPEGEGTLTYTWAATAEPAGANPAFNDNGTNTAKDAIVTFDEAGAYTFTVSISDGTEVTTSTVDVTVEQAMSGVAVSPADVLVHADATSQFAGVAQDQFGNPMATQPAFAWAVAAGDGTVDANGLYTAGDNDGSAAVTATAAGFTGSGAVVITHDAPTIAQAAVATPAVVTGTTAALTVLGADASGEPYLSYTWSTISAPAGPATTFSANGTNAAKNAVATFGAPGSYTVTVTVSDGTLDVMSTTYVTVVQTASTVAVSPATSTLNDGAVQPFSATIDDQFGQPLAAQPAVVWSLASGTGTVDSTGMYTAAGPDGLTIVEASVAGLSGAATVTVIGQPPTITTPASADPATVTGTDTAVHVRANALSGESLLTYAWAMTAGPDNATPTVSPNGTHDAQDAAITFNKAGAYTFTVTASDGIQSVTSAVSLTVSQVLHSLTISPGTATVDTYQPLVFTAAGYDQFGDPMATPPQLVWGLAAGSTGLVESSGLYVAVDPGAATVVAVAGAVSAAGSVTVIQPTPTVTVPANADDPTVTSSSTGLHVVAQDGAIPASSLTYRWAMAAGPQAVSFSANNSAAAADTEVTFYNAGSYAFTVTVIGPDGRTASSDVQVTVTQSLTFLTVYGTPDAIIGAGTSQMTVFGTDQFGNRITSPGVTWSLDNGSVGSTSQTGLYDNGGEDGSARVRATAGAITAAATVTTAGIMGTTAAVSLNASADQPSAEAAVGMLHANSVIEGTSAPVTYTWTILSQPTALQMKVGSKHKVSAAVDGSGTLATFGDINGTSAAANCPVTFLAAGTYIFQVVATDGTQTATDTTTLTVARAATDPSMTTVADLQPVLSDTMLTGYVVTFNHPLAAATANDIRGYHIVQQTEVNAGRNFLQRLFNVHKVSRVVNTNLKIASAVYDPASLTVALTLAKPVPVLTSTVRALVLGNGPHAIRDASGAAIDGNNDGVPGGNFSFSTQVVVRDTQTMRYADGDVGTLRLIGPGQLVIARLGASREPYVYVLNGDALTSVVVGNVKRSKRGAAVESIGAIINSSSVTIRLGSGFTVDAYL